jgi:hypothetical protein
VELIVERRPAALDVQKAQVTACVRVADERLGTTSIDLQAIDPEGIITAVRARRAPMMSASAGLRL